MDQGERAISRSVIGDNQLPIRIGLRAIRIQLLMDKLGTISGCEQNRDLEMLGQLKSHQLSAPSKTLYGPACPLASKSGRSAYPNRSAAFHALAREPDHADTS